jgi:predicted MFS family arabinose efflux permease
MWLLPLSFFTYQFILRLWPSLMMQPIMEQFHIDATSFGLLASVYYYGYALMQIPIAMLLDRYGPRPVLFTCALLCGGATLIFSTTHQWHMALLSRFLVGVGSAVGFLGTSKVVSQWFGRDQYSRMIGFTFTIGLMGAIYGGKPVSLLVERLGWEKVAFTLAFVSLSMGTLTYLFLRSPAQPSHASPSFSLRDTKSLLSSPFLWILALANLLMVGSLEGFADVWGVNYLMTAYGLSKGDAAQLISFIFVGMLFGGPLLALWSQKMGLYPVITLCGLGMAGAFCFLLFFKGAVNGVGLAALFFSIGLMCCYQVLVFGAGCDLVSPSLLGVTVGFLNCINMLGGSFFHTIIGFLMDTFWTGHMNGGIRQYTPQSYTHALLVIPVCALIGAAMIGFLGREIQKKARR